MYHYIYIGNSLHKSKKSKAFSLSSICFAFSLTLGTVYSGYF